MHLKTLLKPLLATVAGALIAGSAHAAPTLKLGLTTWIGYSPFYVADALDLYKKYNLKVKLQTFTDPAMLPSAMAGGAVDGALMTYDQVVGAAGQGQNFKVVMPIDYSYGGDAVLADKSITQVSQLKGKKVAYAPLSPSDFLLAYALKINGMSDKDIQPVNMTPEAVPAAMASGATPAGVTYEPNVSQIIDAGKGKFHVIYSSREAPGIITDVLAFDAKKLGKDDKQIMALMRGYLDGLAYMKAKPAEAAKLIGNAVGVSDKEALEQLTGVHNIPLADMPKTYAKGKDTTSFYVSGGIINELLLKNGQIKKAAAIPATLDDRYVKALLK
jgi:NitT/TauT family transport system substrate-binding protein